MTLPSPLLPRMSGEAKRIRRTLRDSDDMVITTGIAIDCNQGEIRSRMSMPGCQF